MFTRKIRLSSLVLLLNFVVACAPHSDEQWQSSLEGSGSSGSDGGTGSDSGSDAGTGSGTDAGTGSGSDAGTGSGSDAGTGSGSDAGTGSGSDAGTGSGSDAGTGSGSDAGSPDAGNCAADEQACGASCCNTEQDCVTVSGAETCVERCDTSVEFLCGTTCCPAAFACTGTQCTRNCTEDKTDCIYDGGRHDCCETWETCGSLGCSSVCGAGEERCREDCCFSETQFCDGWSCREKTCDPPSYSCGTACCGPNERCDAVSQRCLPACEATEIECGSECCPANSKCTIDGIAGTCDSSVCAVGEIACESFGNTACCDGATERCFNGRCVPSCDDKSTCGLTCCDDQCGGQDANAKYVCCAQGEIGCGHGTCCGAGERCTTDGCAPDCPAGQFACADTCCGDDKQCVEDGHGGLRCADACGPTETPCGVEGLCCAAGTQCATDENGTQYCAPTCTATEVPCGFECCRPWETCQTNVVPNQCYSGGLAIASPWCTADGP